MIAAVEGHALAGGFEMALACDLIVAARDASFGLPEVKRGLVPFSGGMVLLPSRIPYHIAMEAVLTGEPFSAERMHGYGLVNRLADPGQALDTALEIGRRIMIESRDWRASDVFDMQRPLVTHIFESADAREGALAFAEKHSPAWRLA